MEVADYDIAVARLEGRVANVASQSWTHPDANRLEKYGTELLTFLWYREMPSDNNAGQRAIRPAVMDAQEQLLQPERPRSAYAVGPDVGPADLASTWPSTARYNPVRPG